MLDILMLVLVAAATAALGGWIAWRRSALDENVPPSVIATAGMLGRDYRRFVEQQQRRRRFWAAARGALLGLIFGALGMAILAASLAPKS